MAVSIEIFVHLCDNYCILLHDEATGATASIDAIDEHAIRAGLLKTGWNLTDIFITHHHWDHTDGIMGLKSAFDIQVTGPRAEANKIHGLDNLVASGDSVRLGETHLNVIPTPGHTLGHIAYYDPENYNLFSGDALFSLGCGRMFEGTPSPMWEGLKTLRDLPDQTQVYCGHEYSAGNAAFARSIDPHNRHLQNRAEKIIAALKKNLPTVPFNLGEDKLANPFLRADDSELAKAMGENANDPSAVFATIRKAKDSY